MMKFKICLVTYKALCNNQPIYLKEMLEPPKRTRDLRSSDQNVLLIFSQNIPSFQQLCAILPESIPPSQNIPQFSTPICHPPRIYSSLPEYTPISNNYMRPSQNLPLPPRIYPLSFSHYMRPSQNLPFPPRIYPLPFSTPIMRPSQNLPLPSRIYPLPI